MIEQVATAGGHLLRRMASDEPPQWNLPAWAPVVFLADAIIFLPIFLVLGYTLHGIYPILAMVEDPGAAAYEPVSLNEETESLAEDHPPRSAAAAAAASAAAAEPAAITSSLRATNRLLFSVGGWKASFRGIGISAVTFGLTGIIAGMLSPLGLLGRSLGSLVAALALVQLHTAWVHAIIATRESPNERSCSLNPLALARRLPPFRRTFEATAAPAAAYWLSGVVLFAVPAAVFHGLGLDAGQSAPYDPTTGGGIDGMFTFDRHAVWKLLLVMLVAIAVQLLVHVPARVVLVRVQASLLDPGKDAIVPFDRTFGGRVGAAVIDGKGWATMRDAVFTFSRERWVRLYKVYLKVMAIQLGVYLLIVAVVAPEMALMQRAAN